MHPPLKEFLIRMFERGFTTSVQTEAKNLNIASGMTRAGLNEELRLIDAWLSEAINKSIDLVSAIDQRPIIGRQLDIAEDIYLMGHQLAIQRLRMHGRCPIARMDGVWIPVLTFEFGSDVWEGTDPFIDVKFVGAQFSEHRRVQERFDLSDAMASEIPNLMERPLARFLEARLLESSSPADGAAAPNVEVQNTQHGWQVIYSPAYLLHRNGLGGPSTPVKGYVSPGTYLFGIAKPGEGTRPTGTFPPRIRSSFQFHDCCPAWPRRQLRGPPPPNPPTRIGDGRGHAGTPTSFDPYTVRSNIAPWYNTCR
jgi:hypothetical protein